jgi:hypothetical protein
MHPHRTPGRSGESGEELEGRRLARAVRSEVTDRFPASEREADVPEGVVLPVPLPNRVDR